MVIDILIVTVITLSIIICYRKGVILSLFNMVSAVLSFAMIAVSFEPVTEAFKSSYVGKMLADAIRKRVSGIFLDTGDSIMHSPDTPQFVKKFFYSGTDTAAEAITMLTDKVFNMMVGIVVFVLLVIAIRLAVKFIPGVLNTVARIPLLKQANKLFGGAIGIVLGIIWSVVLIHVVGLLSLVPELGFLDKQISDSVFIVIMRVII